MLGRFLIGLTGVVFLVFAGGVVWFADRLNYGVDGQPGGDMVLLFVVATMVMSTLYIVACIAAHRDPPRVFFILFIGGLARLVMIFGSPGPLLEGDHARLRYDARLINRGVNPYAYRPQELLDGSAEDFLRSEEEKRRIAMVRAEMTASTDGPRPTDVARPDLRTTATPAALTMGAAADRFKPQNTRGYVFFVLCADALAAFLLLLALRSLEFPLAWIIVYAWSPVLLIEGYGTLGVDPFVLPGLALLVLALVSGRRMLAGIGAAAVVMLRPAFVILAPILVRRAGVMATILMLVVAASTFLPFVLAPDTNPAHMAQGTLHQWRHFEFNSLVENLVRGALGPLELSADYTLSVAGVEIVAPGQSLVPLVAKVLCLVLLLGIVTYLAIRVPDRVQARSLPGLTDLFVAVAAMLLLAPVLHPSMTIWLLPILAVRVFGIAWLALPSLTMLGYLTHLSGPGMADYQLPGTPVSYRVLAFGIFGLLLIVDRFRGRQIFPSAAAWEEDLVWRVGAEEDLPIDVELAEFETSGVHAGV
ncbi:MAG: hypothetical protein AAGE01_22955 [Pseudomonadota bacterium]